MIRVQKSMNWPRKLAQDGVPKTDYHCAEYDSSPEKYRSGEEKLKFDRTIYGDVCVKEALKQQQFEKCCYCESRISTSYGDVEHFRPKKGVRQARGKRMQYPGYYWLAYDWTNLYYSCEICNRSFKRNFFPLADDRERARDHYDSLGQEQPLLVDPGGTDDPRNHIGFHQEIPVHRTEQGRVTIEILGLDRPDLNEARKEHLAVLQSTHRIVKVFVDDPRPEARQLIHEAKERLDSAVRACAIFSSMAQDLLVRKQ